MNSSSAESYFLQGGRYFDAGKYSSACKQFELAVKFGHVQAYFSLGFCYFYGKGVPENHENAARYFEMGANKGDGQCQFCWGHCLYHGRGTEKNTTTALCHYNLSVQNGNSSAQYCLGLCYRDGNDVEKDISKAIELFRLSAGQNNSDAQFELACYYYFGDDIEKDVELGASYFKLSAEQGNFRAQWCLGDCYHTGLGMPKNFKAAIEWFKISASSNYHKAQLSLGHCYFNGNGVKIDDALAMEYFGLAAAQGNKDAQYQMGHCLVNGCGESLSRKQLMGAKKKLSKEEVQALRIHQTKSAAPYFGKAAQQGHVEAQFELAGCFKFFNMYDKAHQYFKMASDALFAPAQLALARCYHEGKGVEKDLCEGMRLCELAIAQGNLDALCVMGEWHMRGEGVTMSYADAIWYFRQAADEGHEPSQKHLATYLSELPDPVF